MSSIWQEDCRHELLSRLDRLAPEAPAHWGKFTASAMMAHLNDSMRMVLGELTPPPRRSQLLRRFPLKQLVIYYLPFPKGVPTAPLLLERCDGANFRDEAQAFRQIMDRLAKRADQAAWPPHPAFGAMSRRDWGVLGYRHIDHHFRQFGV